MKKYIPFEFLAVLLGICLLAACSKDVNPKPSGVIPDSVDLGLSVNWASCNLGAVAPEGLGSYYQWAGTEDVTPREYYLNWSNCPYHMGTSSSYGFTKYNSNPSYGTVDNKTVLDSGDDVANEELGGNWRIPTGAEWAELLDNCTWTWSSLGVVRGYKVTSNVPGYTSNYIFIPTGGTCVYDEPPVTNYQGAYWSSTKNGLCHYAQTFFLKSLFASGSQNLRWQGLNIRPVYDK